VQPQYNTRAQPQVQAAKLAVMVVLILVVEEEVLLTKNTSQETVALESW
jgi:hypothetical protein